MGRLRKQPPGEVLSPDPEGRAPAARRAAAVGAHDARRAENLGNRNLGSKVQEFKGSPMLKRLRALLNHDQLDHGLNAEVRFHIEMETEKNLRSGMSPDEARRAALRSFGPMERHKEETRDARGVSWFENFVADLRYGARA